MATHSNNDGSGQQPPERQPQIRILGATQVSNPIVLGASQVRADDVTPPRPPLQGRPKVLARPQDTAVADSGGKATAKGQNGQPGSHAQPQKTLEQKQEEYAAARARIFGESGAGLGDDDGTPQVAQSSSAKVGKALMRRGPEAGYYACPSAFDPDYGRWGGSPFPLGFAPMNTPAPMGMPNSGIGFKGAPSKGKSKGPSGPFLPRQRISSEKFIGQVIEWKGKFGWIHASTKVDHPKARKHQNKIFISTIDIKGSACLSPGDYCSFFVFEDEAGIGAEECTIIDPQEGVAAFAIP